jgi:hypothetical protein
MKSADIHIYYDHEKSDSDALENYMRNAIHDVVVVSPQCTVGTEPAKNRTVYRFQHILSNFFLGQKIQKYLTNSFYNDKNQLKPFFRLFSARFKALEKVMIPDNSKMIEKFQSINEIKIWCWINPKSANSVQDLALLAHKKVFGLKIHMFWHKLTIEDLRKFMSQYVIKLDKPIYLILDWVDSQELETFLKEYSTYTWILGYGGFPITKNGIEIISKLDNIYIDISSFHLSIKWLKTIRAKVDPRKILYSTDFPYNFNLVGEEFSYKLFEERLIKSGIEVNAIRLNSYRMVKGVN